MTVWFYAQTDAYAEFSNFAPYGVEMDGVWWRTVEHYFQAQKFEDAGHSARIRDARRPKDAAILGRSRALPIRPDWETVKDTVMLEALRVKFRTHPALRALLLETGNQEIVENAPGDFYWGCGADGSGRNRLGQLLMQVRGELRQG